MKRLYNILFSCCIILLAFAFSYRIDFPNSLRDGLLDFYRNSNQEKVHIILNQPGYAPGDTAFFKAYLMDAANRLPLKRKDIINLKLFNRSGKLILHNRMLVEQGTGASQFILPDTLNRGNYLLIGYSDTMGETTDEELYFRKQILVTGQNDLTYETAPLSIFVEGHNFIENFSNTIVVAGLNRNDSVHVTDSDQEVLLAFKASDAGLARFNIIPERNKTYSVSTKKESVPLPPTELHAIGLSLQKNRPGHLIAKLFTASDSVRNLRDLHLVLTLKGKICKAVTISFENSTTLSVPLETEPGDFGTAQLTLFSRRGDVLAERLVFIPPKPVNVEVNLGKPAYKTRQLVEGNINISDMNGVPITGDAAISVYKKELFAMMPESSGLFESLFFESDLGYANNGPHLSVDHSEEAIDNFLITQKWKRFKWDEILEKESSDPKPVSPYYFKGKVVDGKKRPIPDSSEITFWLTDQDLIYAVKTKGNQFEFPLFMNFSDDYVLYGVASKGIVIKDAAIEVDNRAIGLKNNLTASTGTSADPYHSFSIVKKAVHKSYAHYTIKTDHNVLQGQTEQDNAIEADFTVDIKQYKPFANVPEMLKEVIPMVRNKKTDGKSNIRVFMKETAMFAPDAPLYWIDGIVTNDTDYFLSMDPSSISTVGLVHSARELSRFGVLGRNGIITIDTSMPASHATIPRGKNTLFVKGINPPIEFKSPGYSRSSNARVPDLRATLYWDPDLLKNSTDATSSIRFYTGDDSGEYVVKIEGITIDGRPFKEIETFTVRP